MDSIAIFLLACWFTAWWLPRRTERKNERESQRIYKKTMREIDEYYRQKEKDEQEKQQQ